MKNKLFKRGDVITFEGVSRIVFTTIRRPGPGGCFEIVFDKNVVNVVLDEDGKPITIIRSNESP